MNLDNQNNQYDFVYYINGDRVNETRFFNELIEAIMEESDEEEFNPLKVISQLLADDNVSDESMTLKYSDKTFIALNTNATDTDYTV